MRRRLLANTLAVALVSVVTLGLPLGLFAQRDRFADAEAGLSRDAVGIALIVDERSVRGLALDNDFLRLVTPPDRRAVLTLPGGGLLASSPRQRGVALISVQVDAGQGRTLEVSRPRADVQDGVLATWVLVVILMLLSVAVAVVLAVVLAGRLSRPLEDIAANAGRLGTRRFTPTGARRYGVAELDHVAEVLDSSAARISALLQREREFATEASHQLRTPLTALSIRLEEILGSSSEVEVREEASEALGQADRLTGVVAHLLSRTRENRASTATSLSVEAVIDEEISAVAPAYVQAGRALENASPQGLRAVATRAGFSQALAVLLDNGLRHGAGAVCVSARTTAHHVVVEVSDDGTGVPRGLVGTLFDREVSGAGGTGLGLTLARALVESDGGRIALLRARPPVFAIFLPRDEDSEPEVATGPVQPS